MRTSHRIRRGPSILAALLASSAALQCDPDPDDGDALPDKQIVALSTGIDLAYIELGAPGGEPVVFVHGYTDTLRSFYPTAVALAGLSADHRLLLLDMRGHGGSSMPPAAACAAAPEQCFRPIDMADDVVAFMDALAIDRASVVGHSMGSFVAQELGVSYPERVDRLALIGSAPRLAGNVVLQDYILAEPVEGSWKAGFEAQGLAFPADVYDLTPGDAGADAETWIETAWVVDPAADPELLAAIAPETAATRMGAWIGAARALLATDNAARLADVDAPTLVLWATQDAIVGEAEQLELLADLDGEQPPCAAHVFKQYGKRPLDSSGSQTDDLGHNTQWAAPDEVARDLAAFLHDDAPTDDWYYSADGDPQQIVTEPGAAPIVRHEHCDD